MQLIGLVLNEKIPFESVKVILLAVYADIDDDELNEAPVQEIVKELKTKTIPIFLSLIHSFRHHQKASAPW